MPEKATLRKAKKALRRGKSPSTAAGEFVKEEIEHIREGKHGARSPEQAIAIGLAKARRAGVPLEPPEPGKTSEQTRRSARRDYETGQGKRKPRATSRTRSKATTKALKHEGKQAASKRALSAHSKRVAKRKAGTKTSRAMATPRKRASVRSASQSDASAGGRWSQRVTETSHAMDLEERVFAKSPTAIARSLKRSAESSKTRKASPFQSAMSMLNFYENRAGRTLPAERRQALEKAKAELRHLFGRDTEAG
ncbi:MAG TPA: DUF3175 domain-containing protein [Polyangiaceae bacterium]|nr:DUF3175 domain-containing protein [Polyangiaceae bacterium]